MTSHTMRAEEVFIAQACLYKNRVIFSLYYKFHRRSDTAPHAQVLLTLLAVSLAQKIKQQEHIIRT